MHTTSMIEPTAVAVHALSRGHMLAGETIAVIGCGGVGLLLAMVAIAQGFRVVVLEPNAIRRDAALAAGVALAWSEQDPDKLWSLLEQAGVSVIFECAGLPITAPSPLWLRLDYVFASSDLAWRLVTCEVIAHPQAHTTSDHLPVCAEFQEQGLEYPR